MTLHGDAKPYPKSAATKPGRQRRYRHKIASPKRWQALIAEKIGPCRVCGEQGNNGVVHGKIQLHHIVSRQDGGDDVADNLAPLCPVDHDLVTRRDPRVCKAFLIELHDAEYAYMIQRGGENYAERAYGLRYSR